MRCKGITKRGTKCLNSGHEVGYCKMHNRIPSNETPKRDIDRELFLQHELDNWSDIFDLKEEMIKVKSIMWIALGLSIISTIGLIGVLLWVV